MITLTIPEFSGTTKGKVPAKQIGKNMNVKKSSKPNLPVLTFFKDLRCSLIACVKLIFVISFKTKLQAPKAIFWLPYQLKKILDDSRNLFLPGHQHHRMALHHLVPKDQWSE